MTYFRLTVKRVVPLVCFGLYLVSRVVVKQAVEVGTNAGIPSYETSIFLLIPGIFLSLGFIALYLNIYYGVYRKASKKKQAEKEYLIKYYNRLREIPCQTCNFEDDCGCDSQMHMWVADIMPFIHSPLLKEVIDSFQSMGMTET